MCAGSVINLSVAPNLVGGLTASYAWSGPAGTSTMQNPAISNATTSKAGIYTVTVTYSNGCVATASTNVVVNAKPVVSAATPSCIAGVGKITVTATGTGLSYNIGSGSQTSNVFNSLANGIYTVTVTNDLGCTATANVTLNCTTCPTPIASNNSPLCTGSVINLSVAPNLVSGLTASYAWSGPSGSSTMQNPAISNATPSKAGIYTVTVTYSNGCVATASTNVVVNTKPVVSAATPSCVAGVGTITVTATGTGLTYDIGSGSQTSNVFDNLANGTYTVTVTNSAVCSSTKSATINCSGSVQQNNKQDANLLMIVQPNPFRTETQINFTLPKASLVTLCIYDLQGRLVATLLNNSVEEKGLHQIQFDATNLSNGIYFCQLHTPDVIATQQLVKLKR